MALTEQQRDLLAQLVSQRLQHDISTSPLAHVTYQIKVLFNDESEQAFVTWTERFNSAFEISQTLFIKKVDNELDTKITEINLVQKTTDELNKTLNQNLEKLGQSEVFFRNYPTTLNKELTVIHSGFITTVKTELGIKVKEINVVQKTTDELNETLNKNLEKLGQSEVFFRNYPTTLNKELTVIHSGFIKKVDTELDRKITEINLVQKTTDKLNETLNQNLEKLGQSEVFFRNYPTTLNKELTVIHNGFIKKVDTELDRKITEINLVQKTTDKLNETLNQNLEKLGQSELFFKAYPTTLKENLTPIGDDFITNVKTELNKETQEIKRIQRAIDILNGELTNNIEKINQSENFFEDCTKQFNKIINVLSEKLEQDINSYLTYTEDNDNQQNSPTIALKTHLLNLQKTQNTFKTFTNAIEVKTDDNTKETINDINAKLDENIKKIDAFIKASEENKNHSVQPKSFDSVVLGTPEKEAITKLSSINDFIEELKKEEFINTIKQIPQELQALKTHQPPAPDDESIKKLINEVSNIKKMLFVTMPIIGIVIISCLLLLYFTRTPNEQGASSKDKNVSLERNQDVNQNKDTLMTAPADGANSPPVDNKKTELKPLIISDDTSNQEAKTQLETFKTQFNDNQQQQLKNMIDAKLRDPERFCSGPKSSTEAATDLQKTIFDELQIASAICNSATNNNLTKLVKLINDTAKEIINTSATPKK